MRFGVNAESNTDADADCQLQFQLAFFAPEPECRTERVGSLL
jgi:hypothetical protein